MILRKRRARKEVGKDMAGATAQRLIVNTLKWELSKLHPEQYGDRIQLEQAAQWACKSMFGLTED
jgi:hypothetical protein